ncbi:MAG: RND family transporter [Puniceicoccaceae bacterium]
MSYRLATLGIHRPRKVITASLLAASSVLFFASLPSLFPESLPLLNSLKVDTDPENMLAQDEPTRLFHRQAKAEFSIHHNILLGVINRDHPDGVFTPETLSNIQSITDLAHSLEGVVQHQLIAPSKLDNIQQVEPGFVAFDWIMPAVPQDRPEALAVRDRLLNLPILRGSVVSTDGRALALQIPLESKDLSYQTALLLREHIDTLPETGAEYHITGLPVANDTFGVEMFIQMAISAPLAMGLIFLLMWAFFRDLRLIISPLLVALLSVIITMGLLVITGHTIHIMSSMIPIFIMPIAVLDGVHILSEFYDRYPETRDRRQTIQSVMRNLWRPMLFTSLTTIAGFGSLALAPIPPVQVFGVFVAIGVLLAWLLTVLLIPAYIVLFLDEAKLASFGHKKPSPSTNGHRSILPSLGKWTFRHHRGVIGLAIFLSVVSSLGILRIVVNDNPLNWFQATHPLRLADSALNQHFAGTYPAYLSLQAKDPETFKQPEVLSWIANLQTSLESQDLVGKTVALPDLVKTVYRELISGDPADYRLPPSAPAVSQTLLTFEGSHRPDDLYQLVNPAFDHAVIWLQLKSGDNRDMNEVVQAANAYLTSHRPEWLLQESWFGLTFVNTVWQDKMVLGMLEALASSFLIVLLLMVLLFRSFLWGLLAILPLSATIVLIYGAIGFFGKAYDMPVAVLSSLALGLAVDYAIHFLVRSRELIRQTGSWEAALPIVFEEPARAIFRNIVVVGVGFLPLLLAPLVPYQTVGLLISSILVTAGLVTLTLLPALLKSFTKSKLP